MKLHPAKRQIGIYIGLFLLTIIAGLLSRSSLVRLPEFFSNYLGDTLWALMVFWGFAILFYRKSTLYIVMLSIAFSYAIEFSQFYHAPWIDSIRATKLGALILGFGFVFSDLICYTVGIFIGALIDLFLLKPTLLLSFNKNSRISNEK